VEVLPFVVGDLLEYLGDRHRSPTAVASLALKIVLTEFA
jgi:hypothetical protein